MPLLLIACGKSNEKPNNSSKWGDLRKIEGIITPVRSGKLADQDKFTWSKKEFNAEGELILLSTREGADVLEESKSYDAITTYKYKLHTNIIRVN